MRKIISVVLLLLFCTGFSQETAKDETILEFFELIKVDQTIERNFNQMIEMLNKSSISEGNKEILSKFKAKFNYERVQDLYINIYKKHFTEDDIQNLIDFYQTPIGQKFINKQEIIYQEAYEGGLILGKEISQEIWEEMQEN